MVSRALRILGSLVLLSSTAAAHLKEGSRVAEGLQGWSVPSSTRGSVQARTSGARPKPSRDATGRVWSHVDLGQLPATRAADGRFWTTRSSGGWSYSYSSDGTRCVSQRTAQRVFISCN